MRKESGQSSLEIGLIALVIIAAVITVVPGFAKNISALLAQNTPTKNTTVIPKTPDSMAAASATAPGPFSGLPSSLATMAELLQDQINLANSSQQFVELSGTMGDFIKEINKLSPADAAKAKSAKDALIDQLVNKIDTYSMGQDDSTNYRISKQVNSTQSAMNLSSPNADGAYSMNYAFNAGSTTKYLPTMFSTTNGTDGTDVMLAVESTDINQSISLIENRSGGSYAPLINNQAGSSLTVNTVLKNVLVLQKAGYIRDIKLDGFQPTDPNGSSQTTEMLNAFNY